MMRETIWKFQTKAGVEIGVASTKAFTTQLLGLYLLALSLSKLGNGSEKIENRAKEILTTSIQRLANSVSSEIFSTKFFEDRGMTFT